MTESRVTTWQQPDDRVASPARTGMPTFHIFALFAHVALFSLAITMLARGHYLAWAVLVGWSGAWGFSAACVIARRIR